MAKLSAIANLGFVLHADYLLALSLADDSGSDFRTRHGGRARDYPFPIGNQQNISQLNDFAFFRGEPFHLYGLAYRHLILFSTGLNNSVNFLPSSDLFGQY